MTGSGHSLLLVSRADRSFGMVPPLLEMNPSGKMHLQLSRVHAQGILGKGDAQEREIKGRDGGEKSESTKSPENHRSKPLGKSLS